jgi:hypothetical protein
MFKPTIHMNQCDFKTRTFHEWTEQIMWMNMQPYHPFESLWLHNLNFHKWTEWMIWMNVTPP